MFSVNQYFEGKVASIAFTGEKLPSTVGVMAAGEYQFSTSQKEVMTPVSGSMTVKLPGETTWQTFNQGDSFVVPANSSFDVKISGETAYLCTYE